jgi:hypothetical protein
MAPTQPARPCKHGSGEECSLSLRLTPSPLSPLWASPSSNGCRGQGPALPPLFLLHPTAPSPPSSTIVVVHGRIYGWVWTLLPPPPTPFLLSVLHCRLPATVAPTVALPPSSSTAQLVGSTFASRAPLSFHLCAPSSPSRF